MDALNNAGSDNNSSLFWLRTDSCEQDLQTIAQQCGITAADDLYALEMAIILDNIDILSPLRKRFAYPTNAQLPTTDSSLCDGKAECIYLCGNSLGLMPLGVRHHVDRQLQLWSERGVTNWFRGSHPWADIDEQLKPQVVRLVGARLPSEVCVLNTLTVNINILLSTFYRPTGERHLIIMEAQAFPSDHYAVYKQILSHGFDPKQSLLICEPRPGEHTLRMDDVCRLIELRGRECAVVWFSGVQFYTGQLFDLKRLIACAHAQGCLVGLDLAHAIGQIELHLNAWQCDFATWCSYKYVNAGPGGVAGIFVHEKHHHHQQGKNGQLGTEPTHEGWWGHTLEQRFEMNGQRELCEGAEAYRMSCPPVMNIAPLCAALEVFDEAGGMKPLVQKQYLLTGYLLCLLDHMLRENSAESQTNAVKFKCITPRDPLQRGCQLSLVFSCPSAMIFDEISRRGVVCDERKPNVIRIAPAPLYNSFKDVYQFVQILRVAMDHASKSAEKPLTM